MYAIRSYYASLTDLPPLGMDVYDLVEDFRRYYTYTLGRDRHSRSAHYAYQALVLILRDRLMERWKSTRYAYEGSACKQAYYLSLEFLIGRSLGNAMLNLALGEASALALQCLGLELVITSYSIHYTKLYERKPPAAATSPSAPRVTPRATVEGTCSEVVR